MKNLSDSELFNLCRKWGTAALEARRKFAGLLPEVKRREVKALLKGRSWLGRRGYSCIYDFAARLAGMSRDQVNRILQLERKFESMPVLHKALVDGEVSVNKLARVVSIATKENQEELRAKVDVLSQKAVEIYVKDQKIPVVQDGLFKGSEAVRAHEKDVVQLPTHNVKNDIRLMEVLSHEVKARLLKLAKQGHDINEIVMNLLEEREKQVEDEIHQTQEELQKRKVSRHVPVAVKRVVTKKYGNMCAVEGCSRKAVHLHHEKLFSQHYSHAPELLKPLCKAHHELTHSEDKIVQKFRHRVFT